MAGSLYPKHKADFLAEVKILPLDETRRTKLPRNGLRLALAYPDDFDAGNYTISDVWPDFLDADGHSMPGSIDLEGTYQTEMHILFPEMVEVHFSRLSANPYFLCTEGQDVVARGRMIRFFDKP